MSKYVIVHGNVSTGIEEVIGPFDGPLEAAKWKSENGLGDDPFYPYVPLKPPEEASE
jgi:hypothetical protein